MSGEKRFRRELSIDFAPCRSDAILMRGPYRKLPSVAQTECGRATNINKNTIYIAMSGENMLRRELSIDFPCRSDVILMRGLYGKLY